MNSTVAFAARFGLFGARETECAAVHHVNSSAQCQFVNATETCHIDEGYIDYTVYVYCAFSAHLIPLAVTVLMVWWLFLFMSLAITAENFFCPSLCIIARTLRMSDNIAGVTLLAFGNGAPDVFSALSAVENMKNDDVGLVLGALLGAGVFLTTVVVGAVSLCGSFHLMERPFLRDVIFYIVAVFFTFFVCYDGKITLFEAFVYLAMYVVYVVVVVLGRIIYQYQKQATQCASANSVVAINEVESDSSSVVSETMAVQHVESIDVEHTEYIVRTGEVQRLLVRHDTDVLRSSWREFAIAVSPIEIEQWKTSSCLSRLYAVFKAPALFILKLTIPVVDYSLPRHNWNKHLSIIHCIVTPVFCIFAISQQVALQCLGSSQYRLWYLFLKFGVILAIAVAFSSQRQHPPVYHWVFAYVAFLAACLWIKSIANEVVNLLQTAGVVFSISNAILGLTLLAWGNSIGDFIADVAMARRGYPRTGISACYGGPLFNTLIGIGGPFVYKILSSGASVTITYHPILTVMFVSLAICLVSTLVIIPLLKFNMTPLYGLYLLVIYVVFLIVAVLMESKVF